MMIVRQQYKVLLRQDVSHNAQHNSEMTLQKAAARLEGSILHKILSEFVLYCLILKLFYPFN